MAGGEVLLLACGVSLDACALSAAGALTSRRKTLYSALMAAGFFGGFQFFMPLAGFGAAASLREIVAAFDHWIAFGLLALVGGRMILDGWRGGGGRGPGGGEFFEFNRMWIPAVATSIDALAVGAGLKFSGAPILVPAAAMGVVTAAASAAGVCFGKSLGKLAGTRALSVAGGVAIILIGANILREHLTGS